MHKAASGRVLLLFAVGSRSKHMKSLKRNIIIYCLAFLIPLLMVVIFLMLCHISPFGDLSLLVGDMERQFISYYSYFRTMISGENDFLYTFSKTLGGDMPGLSAYYLQNPLLFILMLFPEKAIGSGIAAVFALEVALSGLSCSLLLNRRYGYDFASLLFSTAYAFCAFYYAYIINQMYFTCLAMLPLLIFFFLRVIEEGRNGTAFTLALAFTVFMNYYMGYMIIIFLGVVYLSRLILDGKYIRSLKNVLICIINAIMLDAVSLIPTALSLRGEKTSGTADFSFYRKFGLLRFLSGFFSGSTRNAELPQVYCSVAVLIMLILYFVSKKYSIREKAADLSLAAVLAVSMCINTIDAVWHGFNNPVGIPWRYSYMLSLTIVILAYKGFKAEMKKLPVILTAVLMALFLFYSFLSGNPHIDRERLLINLLLVVVISIFILFYIMLSGRLRIFILALLIFVSCSDMVYNSCSLFSHMFHQRDESEKSYISAFETAYDDIGEVVGKVKERDGDFYRIEKTFQYSANDPMLFNYMGLSHSSSCEKEDVRHFMQRMGFRDTGLYAFYAGGSTAFADAFMGVRYLISQWDELEKRYESIDRTDKYYIYRNDLAAPLFFLTNEDVSGVDPEEGNVFELQNNIARATFGKEVFKKAKAGEVWLENAEDCGDGVYKKTGEDRAFVSYDIEVTEDMPLYIYFDAPSLQSAELFVNDSSKDFYFTDTHWNVICAGRYQKGDKVRVSLEILKDELNISEACFYYEDQEGIKGWYNELEEKNAKNSPVDRISSSHLRLETSSGEDAMLMMTIPYDKGWHIRVDGKSVKSEKILGVLSGVRLTSGDHVIDMRYIPVGLIPGFIISLIGVVILVIKNRSAKKSGAAI